MSNCTSSCFGLRHSGFVISPLALLVARIAAHDVHLAFAAHDLAVLANPFDAGADFHGLAPRPLAFKAKRLIVMLSPNSARASLQGGRGSCRAALFGRSGSPARQE